MNSDGGEQEQQQQQIQNVQPVHQLVHELSKPIVRAPISRGKPAILHRHAAASTVDVGNNVDQVEDISEQEILNEQAKNAHYSFDSSVQDTINDHAHTRQETR